MNANATLTSNPVYAAGGLRMMARHLLATIDTTTAHHDRLAETVDAVKELLADAVALVGTDQADRSLWRAVNRMEAAMAARSEEVTA